MGEEKTILLTQDAYDKLKEELAYREGQYRDEITRRIAAARAEGDLSENGGYQAAREEQGISSALVGILRRPAHSTRGPGWKIGRAHV